MRKLLIPVLVFALLIAAGCASQAIAPSATGTPSPEPTWKPEPTVEATVEPTATLTAEPTTEATAAPAAPDFATKEVNLNNVEAAVEGFFLDGELIGTDVTNSGGTVYVTIMYKPITYTEGNDFAVQVGHQAARVMEILFFNPAVNVVTFKGDTAAVEGAMEINMSKETAETVDWTAVIYQAQTDYKAILNMADSNHIDSSISDKLK